MADARDEISHVAHLKRLHASDTGQKIAAKFGQRIAVGSGEADACDDDAREIHEIWKGKS